MLSQPIRSEGSCARANRPTQDSPGALEEPTEICRHWLTGSCPFGVKCAFAHGAGELRDHSLDTKYTSHIPNGSKINDIPFGQTEVPTASCKCTSRCTASQGDSLSGSENMSPQLGISANNHHDVHHNDCDMDLYWLSNSERPRVLMNGRSRALCNRLELEPPTPASNVNRVDSRASCGYPQMEPQTSGSNVNRVKDRAAFSLWHSTNPTLENPSRNSPTSLGVPFRGDIHVVGGGNANRTVPSTAAKVESSLQTVASEDDTWANVARGRFDGSRNSIYLRQGRGTSTSGDSIDTSDRTSDRRIPLLNQQYHHSIATTSPLTDEFSFFEASHCSSRASSIASSNCGATTSSVDLASLSSIDTARWDPSTSSNSFLPVEHAPLYPSVRNVSTPSTRRVPTQRHVNDNPATSTSSQQDLHKSNNIANASMLPWWSVPPLLTGEAVPPLLPEEADMVQKRQQGMSRFSSTSRAIRTQSVSENINPGPGVGSSDANPLHVGWEPLLTYGKKPSGPPDDGMMFQVMSTNIPAAVQPPTKAYGSISSGKPGMTAVGSSSLRW